MNTDRYLGQTLDEKYRLERLLGQGGMGAVYLATHLGTERYVALKLITPQFMRNEEFVERFKREARAAGRLRHPNVVDVTDFGFAHVGSDRVAYLVMEYLDGCTLSGVLAEEQRLPLYWAVDILEQVCSAVHEAHQQGIVHRDLKPDNIWLEPNRLGGYRVKVLDFGIAKLAEADGDAPVNRIYDTAVSADQPLMTEAPTAIAQPAGAPAATSPAIPKSQIATDLETETLINPVSDEIRSGRATQQIDDGDKTRLFEHGAHRTTGAERFTTDEMNTAVSTGLTRVGAILGTPLYMSPEQCRGKHLDARSDIYSLGVIAYQMLAGTPPFTGEMMPVIRAHNESEPVPLRQHAPKVRKRVARLIMSALEKDQTRDSFPHLWRMLSERHGLTLIMRANDRHHLTGERRRSRQHLVSDNSQAVDIRACIQVFAATLLRRHVQRSAEDRADTRETGRNCGVHLVSSKTFGARSAMCSVLE